MKSAAESSTRDCGRVKVAILKPTRRRSRNTQAYGVALPLLAHATTWTEVSPGRFEQPLGALESYFLALIPKGRPYGREEGSVTTAVRSRVHGSPSTAADARPFLRGSPKRGRPCGTSSPRSPALSTRPRAPKPARSRATPPRSTPGWPRRPPWRPAPPSTCCWPAPAPPRAAAPLVLHHANHALDGLGPLRLLDRLSVALAADVRAPAFRRRSAQPALESRKRSRLADRGATPRQRRRRRGRATRQSHRGPAVALVPPGPAPGSTQPLPRASCVRASAPAVASRPPSAPRSSRRCTLPPTLPTTPARKPRCRRSTCARWRVRPAARTPWRRGSLDYRKVLQRVCGGTRGTRLTGHPIGYILGPKRLFLTT